VRATGGAGTPVTGGGGRRGCPVRRASDQEGQRATGVASGGLGEVEKLSNFAGATRGWMFAGARPWDRRRAAGHRSAADKARRL
jgi:hypothetical protein